MNTLECTENDILKYQHGGNVMMLGDFSTRTDMLYDFIPDDNDIFFSNVHLSYIQYHVCSIDNLDKFMNIA